MASTQQTAPKQASLPAAAIDGGHMDAEVVTAAAAAAKAKAAAAAAKPVRPNVKCPCPNCRSAAAGAAGAKGSFSYGKTVQGGGGAGRQQQQQAAAGKGGSKQQDQKLSLSCIAFNATALPAKPLMHAATGKEVEKTKVGQGCAAWPNIDVFMLLISLQPVPARFALFVLPPQPKALQARRDSLRTKLQKLAARLVKRKKE